MKIECIKEKLHKGLLIAERATGKNVTLPILSCILLEAKKNSLSIRSTNLDLGVEIVIPVKTSEEGVVVIQGGILSSFITNIDSEKNINLETTDGTLLVSTPKTKTSIKTFLTDDFPTLPRIAPDKTFSIEASKLAKVIKSVIFSGSVSQIKPELGSVCLFMEEDELVAVATDSFRLAEKRISIKTSFDAGDRLLVPIKNAAEILKILENYSGSVEVSFTKNQVAFIADGLYLTSRLIDGAFPDYKQIIPKEAKTEVVVLKEDFSTGLKIATIFADKFNLVGVSVNPVQKTFELSSKNIDIGENSNRLDAVVKGETITINFNHRYLADCLAVLDADSVSLSFNGQSKPVVIRGISDKSFLYLVMPMNK